MDDFINIFWAKLEPVLQSLVVGLRSRHMGLEFHVGNSSNSVYPLRAFISILNHSEGEELSITVDVKSIKNGFLIKSDVVVEEGVIIADGPSLVLTRDFPDYSVELKVDKWFKSFDSVFVDRQLDIDCAIRNLG